MHKFQELDADPIDTDKDLLYNKGQSLYWKSKPLGTAVWRTESKASAENPIINTDEIDFYELTSQGTVITSFTTNLTGTPAKRQTLWIAITDDGTPRAITWGSKFESSGTVTLPATTVASTRLDIVLIWNDVTNKWRCVSVS